MQEEDASRFQTELEFVQCLCNVRYLHYLAQNKYLEDPAFLNYLDYLQYWNQPQYSRFVVYPQALSFLALLQSEAFRRELSKPELVDMIAQQQYFYGRRNVTQQPVPTDPERLPDPAQ
eukprot:TRINITY_DN5042_c0_g1_i2.p1 TRINITY_DN5042_c0_g1~~TRINITY_DN5042_c0_g1_i2.p1  ORF type:complete len:118 (+),score=17.95 TRINITY_DN5042_c0_g1_i2:197-550(+)